MPDSRDMPKIVLIAQGQNALYLTYVGLPMLGHCFAKLNGQIRKQNSVTMAIYRNGGTIKVDNPAVFISF